jgi:ubiquinone/menaquinone biosynthesis C-methylase UbiE
MSSEHEGAFKKIAPYYEIVMKSVPYRMWVRYLQEAWRRCGRKPGRVLEVCCGTGKLCRLLAREGYYVVGVDYSKEMIQEARRLAREEGLEIAYYVQDVARLRLPEHFDAAFCFFDSLNNITKFTDFRRALQRVRCHLLPGAPFLFDLNTAYAFSEKMFDQEDLSPSSKVRYQWRSHWDPASRLCRVDMDFWVGEESFREVHLQRAYTIEEIEEAMREAGYEGIQIFHAYTFVPPHNKSDRIHVLGLVPE